jgi:hypothetical protein
LRGLLHALKARASAATPRRRRGQIVAALACSFAGGAAARPEQGAAASLVTAELQTGETRRASCDLDDVSRLKRALGERPWGVAQDEAFARFAEALNALRGADRRTWNGPEGQVYAALADVYLWLYENEAQRPEEPYTFGVEAISRLERAHGDGAPFLALLARCASYASGQNRVEEALDLLTEERLARGAEAGCIAVAWAYVVLIDCELDQGRYGAASKHIDAALKVVARGDGPDHLHWSARLQSQLVQLETERGRVDWARAALTAQRKATQHGENRRPTPLDDPTETNRAAWRGRQLLLSELRIDNARLDAPSARVRARRLFDETETGWRAGAPQDVLEWTLRLQATRAVLATDPVLGLTLARGIAQAEGAGAVDRAFCWLLSARAAVDQGELDAAEHALDNAAAVLERASIGDEHVIHARLTAERARTARARAEAGTGEPALDLEADLERLRSALEDFREAWRAAGDEPDGIGFLQFDYRRELLVEVYLLARATHGEEGAAAVLVEELAATQALGGLSRALAATTFDMAAATALLRARGEGLVTLFPGRSELLLVALDGAGPFVVELGAPTEALLPLQRLAMELRRPDLAHDHWRELARAAGAQLLQGELRERVARWSRWSFVQPELVGSLPFEVLDVEGIGVLGLERPTAILPTLPAWLVLERRAAEPHAQSGLVALVEPLRDPVYFAERGARADLTGTTPTACAAPTAEVFTGAMATLAALAEAARGADVLLIWSHGHEARTPGEGAGFEITAPGGAVGTCARASDVAAAFAGIVAPRLVVLGICGALRPEARPGEDASGHLGGTFLALGADVVLASVRDVHATSARTLVDTLLAVRGEGASDSDALLTARRAVAADERFVHPHYWAALSAVGVAHRARD